jgi:Tfp pilus assembly protein PilO
MNRRLLLITSAALGVVVLGWTALVWSPTSHRLHTRQAAADTAVRQREQLKVELSRLQGLQAKAAAEKAEGDRLKAALPDLPSLDALVLGLNTAAAQAGVDVTAIQPSPPSALTGAAIVTKPATAPAGGAQGAAPGAAPGAEPLSEIRFSLTALGGGTQLLDFLNRLGKLSRIVVVDGVSLSGGKLHPGTQGEGSFTATLTARAFVHQAPPSTAAPR